MPNWMQSVARYPLACAPLVALISLLAPPVFAETFVPISVTNTVSFPGAAQHNIPPNSNGNGQGYAIAATMNDGTLRYAHLNNNLVWDAGRQLVNNNNGVGEYGDASPVLMAKDTSNMHVFAVTRQVFNGEWMLASCLMTNGQQDTTDFKRWRDLLTVTYPDALSFGAAEVPDGSGVVFVVPNAFVQTATVSFFRWGPGTDPELHLVVQQTIPMPPGLGLSFNGYDASITAALTRNFDKMARYYPYRLTLAIGPGGGGQVLTRDYRLNTKLPDDLLPRFFLTPIPSADHWQPVGTGTSQPGAALHEGVDGSLNLVCFENGVLNQYRRTGYDPQTQAILWSEAQSLSALRARSLPSFVYRPFNTQNQDIFDINRIAFYHRLDGGIFGIGGYDDLFGKGKRRPLGTTSLSSGALVIGMVDGPPPIPNENLAWSETESRPYELVASETRFGFSQTSQQSISSSVEHGFTVGMNASIGGEIQGFGASVDLEHEVREGHGSSYADSNETRSETFLTVGSNYQNIAGNLYKVMPIGTLYVVKMAFTGFAYEYVDESGNPVPGTRLYYQVYPTGGYTVVTENYWMNPNGRRPGELLSYMFDPEDPKDVAAMEALENASVIEFSGLMPNATQRYLTNHWQDATSVTTTWDYMKSSEESESTSARVSEALKASVKTPVGGIGGSIGQDSEVTRQWSTGGSTNVGLAVNAVVANQRDYPGIYWGCTFQTYLLKDDNAYLRELLSDDSEGIGLVTPTWPPSAPSSASRTSGCATCLSVPRNPGRSSTS